MIWLIISDMSTHFTWIWGRPPKCVLTYLPVLPVNLLYPSTCFTRLPVLPVYPFTFRPVFFVYPFHPSTRFTTQSTLPVYPFYPLTHLLWLFVCPFYQSSYFICLPVLPLLTLFFRLPVLHEYPFYWFSCWLSKYQPKCRLKCLLAQTVWASYLEILQKKSCWKDIPNLQRF